MTTLNHRSGHPSTIIIFFPSPISTRVIFCIYKRFIKNDTLPSHTHIPPGPFSLSILTLSADFTNRLHHRMQQFRHMSLFLFSFFSFFKKHKHIVRFITHSFHKVYFFFLYKPNLIYAQHPPRNDKRYSLL